MNEWTVVSKKSKKCSKNIGKNSKCHFNMQKLDKKNTFEPSDLKTERLKIEKAKQELQETSFCQSCIDLIVQALDQQTWNSAPKCIHELVCYGLGSISNSYISRFQFAMLLLLWDHLKNQDKDCPSFACYAYDPIFDKLDAAIIESYGIQLIDENEEGRREVDSSPMKKITIFYMIHCEKLLYENLLKHNFHSGGYLQQIIIGNSFNAMRERLPNSELEQDYAFIHKALYELSLHEAPFPIWNKNDEIFNDTSIHFVGSKQL